MKTNGKTLNQKIIEELKAMDQWYDVECELAAMTDFEISLKSYHEFVEDSFKRIAERTGASINEIRSIYESRN